MNASKTRGRQTQGEENLQNGFLIQSGQKPHPITL